MKDLTHYFISPTKSQEKTEVNNKEETPQVKNNDVDKVNTEEENVIESTENLETPKNEKRKRGRKKKIRRKPSDPIVKNITELLSNSLSLISPNRSFNEELITEKIKEVTDVHNNILSLNKDEPKESKSKNINTKTVSNNSSVNDKQCTSKSDKKERKSNDSERNTATSSCIKSFQEKDDTNNDISIESIESGPSVSSKNAFLLMMEARKKSIGLNSPGKEKEEVDVSPQSKELKNKLSARKSLLDQWAEIKGATKRKREEEEKELFVNHQMKKRAKRLKNLLQLNKADSCEQKLSKKRKRVTRISSDSDDCVICDDIDKNNTTYTEPIVESNSEISNNLLSFLNVSKKYEEKIELEPESKFCNSNGKEIIKIKMFPTKLTKKNRKSRLSLKKEDEKGNAQVESSKLSISNTSEGPKKGKEKRKKNQSKIDTNNLFQTESICIDIEETTNKNNADSDIIVITDTDQSTDKELKEKDFAKHEGEFLDEKPVKILNGSKISSRKLRKKKAQILDEPIQELKTPVTSKSLKIKIKVREGEVHIIEGRKTSEEINEKRVLRVRKVKETEPESDEDWNEKKPTNTKKKEVSKIAPVFLKAAPKPKLDPEVLEARRQFLMSGIPSSLKRTIEKQQSIEEKELDVFPEIQHVQQKCDSEFWSLERQSFNLKQLSPLKINTEICKNMIVRAHSKDEIAVPKSNKITKYRKYIEEIKIQNPNYPVFKAFRQIFEKSGYKRTEESNKGNSKTKKKTSKRGRPSLDKSVEIVEAVPPKIDHIKYTMWTEKYKPRCSDDILGNTSAVTALKNFLDTWMQFSKDIISRKRKKRAGSTSESEFEMTDGDSRDSTRLPGNIVLLSGPVGSGKSSAVYAVCEELGFKVLEVNASSKRTGKKLLQDMQEATQSHQVKNQGSSVQSFFKPQDTKDKPKEDSQILKSKKMCIILIEDVDLVFEQDESFISALSQLVVTTKRPIIITTTDISSPYAQKFSAQYEVINFSPLSATILSTWLKIVCLIEGFLVDQDTLGMLLEYNNGDVRKTLLQIQFWLQSGGQLFQSNKKNPFKIHDKRQSGEVKLQDDNSNLSYSEENDDKEKPFVHNFEINTDGSIPYRLSLGTIWWNMPNLLPLPPENYKRLNKFNKATVSIIDESGNMEDAAKRNSTGEHSKNKEIEELKQVGRFWRLCDNLAFADEIYGKLHLNNDFEPCVKNGMMICKDSLELEENRTDYSEHTDVMCEIAHTLIKGSVDQFPLNKKAPLNMAVPVAAEKRWRAKNHVCEDILMEAAPYSRSKAPLTLDYLPNLRYIARSELHRSLNNTKRGNRFRHYLKSVGVCFNESTSKLACNILVYDE